MKSVMLVDDEILVRDTIKECIPWEQEGFRFIGDAPDGEIALQMMEQTEPDILITDIMMPFMDGLELSGIVRKRMPRVKIVILSGHGEFEYARSALRLGVEEYCLKPISAANLLQLLHGVSRTIDEERFEQEQTRKRLLDETEKKNMTQDKLLGDLCCGFLTTSEAIHWCSEISLALIAPYYTVVISDARDDAGQAAGVSAPGGIPSQVDKLSPSLPHDAHDGLLAYKRSRTETVWIVKGESCEELEARLLPFRQLREQSGAAGNASAIGIGSVHDRLQGVHLSYLDAEEDMHWQRLSKQNRREMTLSAQMPLEPAALLDRSKFLDFLKLGTPAEADTFIASFVAAMDRQDWETSPLGYYLLNDLTIEVLQVSKQTFRISDQEALARFQSELREVRTTQDAAAYLLRMAEQYWSWRAEGTDKYAELIVKVKRYIEENYDKEHMSLQSASDDVRLSPSHLSKVFSQETGQTFIEYLTRTRIQKAMDLLLTTPAKSYEVAFQVGYNDAHYFSNLFKRFTGMTTKQFRKNGGLSLQPKGEGYEAVFKHG